MFILKVDRNSEAFLIRKSHIENRISLGGMNANVSHLVVLPSIFKQPNLATVKRTNYSYFCEANFQCMYLHFPISLPAAIRQINKLKTGNLITAFCV